MVECPKAVVFAAEGRIETRFGSVLVSIHSLCSLLNRRTLKLAHRFKLIHRRYEKAPRLN